MQQKLSGSCQTCFIKVENMGLQIKKKYETHKIQTSNSVWKLWGKVVQYEDRMMPRDFSICKDFH